MKHTYKFIPANTFDFPAIESWLEDMAAEGLFLVSLNATYGKFRKGKPKKLTYRIEIVQYFDTTPPPKMAAIYEELGWQFVTPYLEKGFLFCAEGKNPVELHTDPIIQSKTVEDLYNSEKKLAICTIVILLLVFVSILGLIWKHLAHNLARPFRFQDYIMLLYFLFAALFSFWELRYLKNLKKDLQFGLVMEHRKPYKKWVSIQRLWVCYGILALILFSCLDWIQLRQLQQEEHQEDVLSDICTPIPYFPLSQITAVDELQHCHFDYTSTLFAPVQFEIYEQSATAWMETDYMEVRPDILVNQAFLTMGANGRFQTFYLNGLDDMLEERAVTLSSDTLTEGHFYRKGTRQMLALREENRLLLVRYSGPDDLQAYADAFAALLEQEYEKPQYR